MYKSINDALLAAVARTQPQLLTRSARAVMRACNTVISAGTDCGGADPDAPTVECTNTCQWANDDYCDDTRTSGLCDLGTDCHDCGPASKGNFTTFDDDGWWDDDENYWDDDYDWF